MSWDFGEKERALAALERIAKALEGPDKDASFADGPTRLAEDSGDRDGDPSYQDINRPYIYDENSVPHAIPGWPVEVRIEDGLPRVYNKIWSSQAGLASFGPQGQPNWTKP